MQERDLYQPVKDFLINKLDCTEVYGEILNLDVLGLCGTINIGIELKTRLSFKLLSQALIRSQYVEYMYIAFPKPKSDIETFVLDWCHSKGIGIMLIDTTGYVWLDTKAKFNRVNQKRISSGGLNIRDKITDFSGENTGGVPSGQVMTPYKKTVQNVRAYLEREKEKDLLGKTEQGYAISYYREGAIVNEYRQNAGDRTVDEMLAHIRTHYAQPKPSLMATLQESWNQDWCETHKYDGKRYFRIRDEER